MANVNTATEDLGVLSANVKLPIREYFSYGLGCGGMMFMFTFTLSFLTMAWSDVLLIPMGVVGLFMLVNKIWDAVNDPIIGWMADRTNTKLGRYRPWLLSFIPLTVFGFLCFVKLPGVSPVVQRVFTFAAYFLWILSWTSMEIPHVSLMSMMTTNYAARSTLAAYRQTIAQVIMLVVMVGFVPMAMKLGGGDLIKGMTPSVAILLAISVPFYLICFFNVKERVKPSKSTENIPIKESFKCLRGNWPAILLMLAHLAWGANVGCTAGTRIFFWQYVAHDVAHISITNLFFSGGMVLGAVATGVFIRMLNKKTVALMGWVLAFVFFVALFFVDRTNFVLIDSITFLQGFCGTVGQVCIFAMVPDVTEYTQVNFGLRASGFIFAGNNFCYKVGIAVVQGLFGVIMAGAGYLPNAEQPASVQNLLWLFLTLFPALLILPGIFAFAKYKITREAYDKLLDDLGGNAPASNEGRAN